MSWQEVGATGVTGEETNPSPTNPTAGPVLSELPPRDSTVLVRTVRDRLRLAIALKEIPEGTRLNQVQVANQLGVSRMPVRAAITDLVTEGLLEPIAGGGVVIRTLTATDMRNVYEVRAALESQAVRHVAQRRPGWGLARIEKVLADHRSRVSGYTAAQLLDVDRDFHMALLDATDNDYFRRAIVPVWSIVERAMFGMLSIPEVVARAWSEHEQIAQALRAGDPDLAERVLRLHLDNGAEDLAHVMPAEDKEPSVGR